MIFFAGCYTDAANPNGLKVLRLDEATGRMDVVAEHEVSNAIYTALSPDGGFLYSCTGTGLRSFAVSDGGRLEKIDDLALGKCVCHVAAMQDGARVVFADYLGGFAGSVAVEKGRFGKVVVHRHHGSGPNLPRQDAAHCHQALPLPDGSGYCVTDLGLDRIFVYPKGDSYSPVREKAASAAVAPPCLGGSIPCSPPPAPGAGPRHLLFHPNGYLAFLVYELGNALSTLRWSRSDGFTLLDTVPTLPPAGSRKNGSGNLAAAIRLSPDGKRAIVSNRGENSLVAFKFNEVTGALSEGARTLLPGNWPRDFIFVNETLALAAMERSGEVHALRYDPQTGLFKTIETLSGLHRPVALLSPPPPLES